MNKNSTNKFACQIGLVIASCLFVLSFPLYSIFWVYPHFNKIITFEKEVSAKQIAYHISKMMDIDSGASTITRASITDRFVQTLKEAQSDFDLTKIKVFSSQGEVLYSTDSKDIGTFNTKPYFADIISQGKIFSKIVHSNEKTMEGEVVKKNVVETYIPMLRDKNFIGAFEIYYDITYSGHLTRKFITKSLIVIILASLFLLLCILLISFSAMTSLKKQLKTEEEIQVLKDKVPPLYNLSHDDTDE